MLDIHGTIQHLIDEWRPADDLPDDDPLNVSLSTTPTTYLPIVQHKGWYNWYGRRQRRKSVFGLNTAGEWVMDGTAKGRIACVYGTSEQAFGQMPVSLSPLLRARTSYPEIASLIWDDAVIPRVEARSLDRWRQMCVDVAARTDVDLTWWRKSGYVGTASGLGRLETPATLAALLDGLSAPSPRIREEAILGLYNTTAGQGLHRSLLALVGDPDAKVRKAVALALGSIGDVDGLPALFGLLHDPDSVVRAQSVEALVTLGFPQSRDAILGVINTSTGISLKESHPRMLAVLALQTFWHEQDDTLVLELLADPAPSVRAAAIYVLGRMHISHALPTVEGALWDPTSEVRVAAAYALLDFAQYDNARVVPRLVEMAVTPRDPLTFIDPFDWQPERESTEALEVLLRMAKNGDILADSALRQLTMSHSLHPPYPPVES